jgi:hypothetical protein
MKNAYNFLPNGFVAGFFKLTRILGRPTSPILYQRRADVKNNVTKFHSYLKKCFARSLLDTSWDYFQLTLAKSTSKLWPKLHLGLDGLSNQKILKRYTTHTSANSILMVVTRAISNFSKNHTFLMCRM